ncbi:MAG: hypothetical protein A2145_04765 [candidate division Zixibacteria bacterium RBG_16_40_9]|nr:MAG: hypothetical protein A2145_04765 [candidate division Zixibacteria bacterium RBG_16_40_9]
MISKSQIVKNVLSNWVTFLIIGLINLALVPFVLRHLGDLGFGVWVLANTVTVYLGLLDLGIRSSVIRYVAKYRSVSDYQNLNQIISTSLVTFTAIGSFALILSVILAFLFPTIFKISPEFEGQVQWVVLLVGLNLALSFPAGVFNGILLGMERFDLNNLFNLVNNVLKAVLILIIFNFKVNLVVLALIQLFSSLVAYLLCLWRVLKLEPNLKISFRLSNKASLTVIFQHGLYSFLLVSAYQIIYYSPNVLIGIITSTSLVTYFAMAAILIEYTRRAVNGVSFVLNPIASSLESRGDFQTLKKLLISGTKYSLLLILPVSLGLIILGKNFITIWLGPSYAEKCYPILVILLLPQIYSMSQFVTEELLMGQTKHRFLALVTVAEAILNLLLSVFLIKKYGIIGAALGVAIPRFLNYLFFSVIYIKKVVEISFKDYLRQSFIPPLVASIPLAIILLVILKFFPAYNWFDFVLEVVLAGLVFLLSAWYFCFSKEERKLWAEKFSFLRI